MKSVFFSFLWAWKFLPKRCNTASYSSDQKVLEYLNLPFPGVLCKPRQDYHDHKSERHAFRRSHAPPVCSSVSYKIEFQRKMSAISYSSGSCNNSFSCQKSKQHVIPTNNQTGEKRQAYFQWHFRILAFNIRASST